LTVLQKNGEIKVGGLNHEAIFLSSGAHAALKRMGAV